MSRILLTGAAGFLGATVLRQLMSTRREVALLLREASDRQRIADLMTGCHVLTGDLHAPASYRQQLATYGPDAVVHLAWTGVKGADRNSLRQFDNVGAATALFEIALNAGCRSFVGVGSQAEYGPRPGRIAPSAPTTPTTVYGAAKLATGMLIDRAAATSGVNAAWLRLFSAYGPGDDPSWLIPYTIGSLLSGQRPSLTAGDQIWDYLHVEDAARAVVAALDHRLVGFHNLGSGQGRRIRDVVTQIRDYIDPSLPLGLGEIAYRPDQVMHLEADIDSLKHATGWEPEIGVDEGIAQTVDWYRANHVNSR